MFRRKTKNQSDFSEFIEQRTRLWHSKVVYAFNLDHEHFYSKNEVLNHDIDPRCKVCGLLLSEYRTMKKFEKWESPIDFKGEQNAG